VSEKKNLFKTSFSPAKDIQLIEILMLKQKIWTLINMEQSHTRSSLAWFECVNTAARVFKDQRECVLSSLTFTPALQALFKVSHLQRYRAITSNSCSAWAIPCWFHTSDSGYRNTNRHMTSVWEQRIDKLLWFLWGLKRISPCVWCGEEVQMN